MKNLILSLIMASSIFSVQIHDAVNDNNLALLEGCILVDDINALDDFHRTALRVAIENRNFKAAELLIANGADVNLSNPLKALLDKGNVPLIERLLREGARLDFTYEHGETPLIEAAEQGDCDLIRLLLSYGQRVDIYDESRYSPLRQAANYFLSRSSVFAY